MSSLFFAQMLAKDVKPLPPTRPDQPKEKKAWKRNTTPAVEQRAWLAKDRYKAKMVDWIRTRALESALGMAKASTFGTLERYEGNNLVERRPFANLPYNQRRGWEWRWVFASDEAREAFRLSLLENNHER